jgi:hypothetical protein
MKIYNSFLEMATATGALNSAALDSLRVYNDSIPPVSPATGGQPSGQQHDSLRGRAQAQADQQVEKADPAGNKPRTEPNKFQQDLADNNDERNF